MMRTVKTVTNDDVDDGTESEDEDEGRMGRKI